jgi:hypothetical protein
MKIAQHIIDEIFMCIKELADKNFQYNVWVLNNVPNYVSSFTDLYNNLTDACPEDLIIQPAEENNLTIEIQKELALMLYLLAIYNDKKKTDKQIIEDPAWNKVVNQAKLVLKMYNERKALTPSP